jgi:hypothetical protein
MDHRHHDGERRVEHTAHRGVPDDAPDPVETRDPASHPVPRRSRVWLYALVPAAFLAVFVFWMTASERSRAGGQSAPYSVTGTSGGRENDPEGRGRGDETPLNAPAEGPRVIGDMELLTQKEDYVGRAVEIPAIAVMSTPGPRTLWVGRPMNRTLVLLDRRAQSVGQIASGQPVRVSGQLERRPDEAAIDRAGLHEDDRRALEGVDVFIRASAVQRTPDTGPTDAPARR